MWSKRRWDETRWKLKFEWNKTEKPKKQKNQNTFFNKKKTNVQIKSDK